MAAAVEKLRLILYPDPRLKQRAQPVTEFNEELAAVIERMIAVMRAEKGVGLAAPQVGLLWRLFVCQPGEDAPPQAFINPTLNLGEREDVREEGCLSIPDVTVNIRRSTTCEISAFDARGRPLRLSGEGLLARIWQHETDHLDGRLITDRMTEAERIKNRRLLKQLEQDYQKRKGRRG